MEQKPELLKIIHVFAKVFTETRFTQTTNTIMGCETVLREDQSQIYKSGFGLGPADHIF